MLVFIAKIHQNVKQQWIVLIWPTCKVWTTVWLFFLQYVPFRSGFMKSILCDKTLCYKYCIYQTYNSAANYSNCRSQFPPQTKSSNATSYCISHYDIIFHNVTLYLIYGYLNLPNEILYLTNGTLYSILWLTMWFYISQFWLYISCNGFIQYLTSWRCISHNFASHKLYFLLRDRLY